MSFIHVPPNCDTLRSWLHHNTVIKENGVISSLQIGIWDTSFYNQGLVMGSSLLPFLDNEEKKIFFFFFFVRETTLI